DTLKTHVRGNQVKEGLHRHQRDVYLDDRASIFVDAKDKCCLTGSIDVQHRNLVQIEDGVAYKYQLHCSNLPSADCQSINNCLNRVLVWVLSGFTRSAAILPVAAAWFCLLNRRRGSISC